MAVFESRSSVPAGAWPFLRQLAAMGERGIRDAAASPKSKQFLRRHGFARAWRGFGSHWTWYILPEGRQQLDRLDAQEATR